jgi:hypothetical protein
LTSWLVSFGFTKSLVDPGVFTIFVEKLIYILAVYVDDSNLTGKMGKFFVDFKTAFSERFEIEDLGPAVWLTGCKFKRDREKRTLRLNQDQYVSKIIEELWPPPPMQEHPYMAAKAVSKPEYDDPMNTKLFPFLNLVG